MHPSSLKINMALGLWMESLICAHISELFLPSWRLEAACPHFKTEEVGS